MLDITHKVNTLRIATAEAILRVSKHETIDRLRNNEIPKGHVFEMAKAAGLLAVKKTPDLLPDCHPLPIESTSITYEISGLEVTIKMTVKTIYKTGVEVEAMHGASVVALTMYDMLKPIDKGVEIGSIRLVSKTGGKSSFKRDFGSLKAHVVICSDSASRGEIEDKSGEIIIKKLKSFEIDCQKVIIPDEIHQITKELQQKADLIIYSGGTGVSPRDKTPEALIPLLDTQLKGVEEQMRRYGQDRIPLAMLSRSVAGIKDGKLILAFPGSAKAVVESIDAIFPHVLHVFHVLSGARHD